MFQQTQSWSNLCYRKCQQTSMWTVLTSANVCAQLHHCLHAQPTVSFPSVRVRSTAVDAVSCMHYSSQNYTQTGCSDAACCAAAVQQHGDMVEHMLRVLPALQVWWSRSSCQVPEVIPLEPNCLYIRCSGWCNNGCLESLAQSGPHCTVNLAPQAVQHKGLLSWLTCHLVTS